MSTDGRPTNGEPTVPAEGGRRVLLRRRRTAVAAAAAAVALAAGGAWTAMASDGPAEAGSAPEAGVSSPSAGSGQQSPAPGGGNAGKNQPSYDAEGRTLKVTFWGGVCGEYTAHTVETDRTVRVDLRAEKPDEQQVCVKMAERRTVRAELDQPLGDREVVDAHSGKEMAPAPAK